MNERLISHLREAIPVSRVGRGEDIRSRVEARIQGLWEAVRGSLPGCSPPPFDPALVARHLGIEVAFARTPPGCDAMLLPLRGRGFQIVCSPRVRSEGRIRFSLAHELAHTLFDDCGSVLKMRTRHREASLQDEELERLCDQGAAELVMPRRWFSGEMATMGERAGSVPELARRFGVSLEAAAVRMVECGSEALAGVGFFEYGTRPSERGRRAEGRAAYRVRRVFTRTGTPFLFPRGKSVPEGSAIYRASLGAGECVGRERFGLGGESGAFRVSAAAVSRGEGPPTVCAVFTGVGGTPEPSNATRNAYRGRQGESVVTSADQVLEQMA